MIYIGLGAVAVLGLIILAAVTEIRGYDPDETNYSPQCTPSRKPQYTGYIGRKYRWRGLELSKDRERAEVKRRAYHEQQR